MNEKQDFNERMYNEFAMEKQTRLKRMLEERGLKQEWVAKQAGVNINTFSRLVTGRHVPTLRTAQRIAKVLGTTVDELWPLDEGDED